MGLEGQTMVSVLPVLMRKGRGNFFQESNGSGNKGLLVPVLDETEADGTVPAAGLDPVPVRGTEVLRFVVPGTATDHAQAVAWPAPLVNTAWEKIARRRPSVSAC
ncbi:hypothetical protein DNFV4_01781 [Nitrospira tepida]|uniref:Uncharacterized protein n=1 Tax=Nitrospira tepida TaxID=2973512 RepID=A0AA86T6U6_9BACT|nr:hypothetical protein DNFV4_01781 [Nitrospira tepida]